jgi:hypothetical protein
VILAVVGVPALLLALFAAALATLGGVGLYFRTSRWRSDSGEKLIAPEPLEPPELDRLYRVIGEALTTVAGQPEGTRKVTLIDKLVGLGVQFRALASEASTRGGIESWYVAHDAVLGIPDLKEYRAVVRVRTAECVRDVALEESMRAIHAAVRRGVFVERIFVLPELLWPGERLLPTDDILPWIEEQHNNGGRVILLRECDLVTEFASFLDICAFDDWAVGTRELDERAQTVRVALDFTPSTIRATLDRMDRLSHVGIPFGELLDRAAANS